MGMISILAAEEIAPSGSEGGILWLVILVGIAFGIVKLYQRITRRWREKSEGGGFVTSVRAALGNYANFKGRATRSEYWWFVLFSVMVQVAASIINETLNNLVSVALLIPGIAVGVRRLHDSDRRGWWLLFPVVNLVLLLKKSDTGENRFGPPTVSAMPGERESGDQETRLIATPPLPAPHQEKSSKASYSLAMDREEKLKQELQAFGDEWVRLSAEAGAILVFLEENPNHPGADSLRAEHQELMTKIQNLSIREMQWKMKPEHRNVIDSQPPARELMKRQERAFEEALERRRQRS